MDKKTLFDSSVILAGVTAFLYSTSSARLGGFLGPLLLDPDVLTRNFQQVLYDGFINSFGVALKFLLVYAAFRFVYSHMIVPSRESLRNSWRGKRKLVEICKMVFGKSKRHKLSQIEKIERLKTYKATGYVVVSIIFVMYFVLQERDGKEKANALLARVRNHSVKPYEFITTKIDGKSETLVFLACGDKNCAAMNPETEEVKYFPQNGHSYHLTNL